MTPDRLVGSAWASLTPAQQSTYRVVRSVAKVECSGQFDSINAYDRAILSAGCYHWTLCLLSNSSPPEDGELSAFLAYLAQTEPAAFERVWGTFGCGISDAFSATWDSAKHKYSSWPTLQAADGSFADAPRTNDMANWFRSWHWFYRVEMACRTVPELQRRMWDYARMRVRDILATEWDGTTQADGHTATIGDYYTSEKAVAMLVRKHVKSPAWVVSGGNAGSSLRAALTRATSSAGWTGAMATPSGWNDAAESRLIRGILDENGTDASGDPNDSLGSIDSFTVPTVGGGLSETRGSLQFDDSGL